MAKSVTMIPATISMHSKKPVNAKVKRRVAGYARVSTGSDEQLTSYEAQIEYYTRYIRNNPEWEFVDVYTDEGISGTNTKHREGFNRMINDALAGEIDLIVTKSVSRFARNTVDSLTTVRKLKERGVEVYFEKENIYTLDSKGELLITIMSSLAQEESRSISENVTWGHRKRFADGKVMMPYSNFLGYDKGPDGQPVINEAQAEIVRDIYSMYLKGTTPRNIAKALTERNIPTPKGNEVWKACTIMSILTNEKYKGAALLQKKFTTDFLTKKQKVNEGEVPQYYVEDSHPAIIAPQVWELVQMEIARRKSIGTHYSSNGVFATRIVCGDCGGFYGPKVWHSNSKNRKIIWRCNDKYKDCEKCRTPHLTEELVQMKFIEAANEIITCKETVLENCREIYETVSNTKSLEEELNAAVRECEIIAELNRKWVDENATHAMSQDVFMSRYNSYVQKYELESTRVEKLKATMAERQSRAEALSAFMFELYSREGVVSEFTEELFLALTDVITVYQDGRMVFRFRNGMEVSK